MTDPLKGRIEFLPDRLYYLSLRTALPPAIRRAHHFFSIDNELVYWNFFLDFGPLNLGQLYRFCQGLNAKLKDERLKDKVIYFCCSAQAAKRANAAYLISAWALLYLQRTPEEAWKPFQNSNTNTNINISSSRGGGSANTNLLSFPPFHDASPCVCTYALSILDCLRGIDKARRFGFFNFNTFNLAFYEHFEQAENGDLNWIVEGKFLAFAGPHNKAEVTADGYCTLTPEDYIPFFKKHNVTLVVRLNKKYYDETKFTNAGIAHADLYFLDGSVPPHRILARFLQLCERTEGAIAVHCKAGLGRTGSVIGAYLCKHYRMTAAEVIGWMRICRPGSVIGPQQHYLEEMEQFLWGEGEIASSSGQHIHNTHSNNTSTSSSRRQSPSPLAQALSREKERERERDTQNNTSSSSTSPLQQGVSLSRTVPLSPSSRSSANRGDGNSRPGTNNASGSRAGASTARGRDATQQAAQRVRRNSHQGFIDTSTQHQQQQASVTSLARGLRSLTVEQTAKLLTTSTYGAGAAGQHSPNSALQRLNAAAVYQQQRQHSLGPGPVNSNVLPQSNREKERNEVSQGDSLRLRRYQISVQQSSLSPKPDRNASNGAVRVDRNSSSSYSPQRDRERLGRK